MSKPSSSTGPIANPYAVKPKPPALFRTPLAELDRLNDNDDGDNDNDDNLLETQELITQLEAETTSNDNFQTTETDDTERNDATNKASVSMPMSVDLPLVERLPSNILPLESAEILTVSEVCHFGGKYYHSRSIRTTGVLRHRLAHEGQGLVSLVLQDPLAKLSATSRTSTDQKSSLKRRRISFGSTTTSTDTTKTNKTATTSTKQRPSLGMAKGRSTTPLIFRGAAVTPGFKTPSEKTPISKLTTTSSSTTTPKLLGGFRTPGLSTRKNHPLIVATPKRSVEETLAHALAQDRLDHTVWIVVNPDHVPVATLQVGDLVTVMGKVELVDSNHQPNVKGQVAKLVQEQEATARKRTPIAASATSSSGGKKQNDNGQLPLIYVQASIIRQDNGANVRLHTEALKLRRRHLFQTYHASSQVKDHSQEPLQGCGPPPYKFDSS